MGISEMIAPVATIGSAELLTIAEGAIRLSLSWYITYDPTVLPFPYGKQNTLFEMLSPLDSHSGSRILDEEGLTPPRNETGDEHTTALPDAFPPRIFLALTIVISPPRAHGCS
jgi:hypothetical protein